MRSSSGTCAEWFLHINSKLATKVIDGASSDLGSMMKCSHLFRGFHILDFVLVSDGCRSSPVQAYSLLGTLFSKSLVILRVPWLL